MDVVGSFMRSKQSSAAGQRPIPACAQAQRSEEEGPDMEGGRNDYLEKPGAASIAVAFFLRSTFGCYVLKTQSM